MVMHARKPQRMNDGYFEKHTSHTSYQSSKYSSSKRDYERDRSSNYRDRDISPGSGGGPLNNGNSYRSQSPDIDSPSSRGGGGHSSHDLRDHRGGGGGGGGGGSGSGRGGSGERYSFIQKMRDRDRDVYKKDKYSDKRDRRGNDRDSESYRTNHDRGDRRGGGGGGGSSTAKLCSSRDNDKRSGSDDRDRERDRDMHKRDRGTDRDRDMYKKDKYTDKRDRNDRGERVARYGDWSEHVSSSGKMYYYNCKTEVSQWEKPKEWADRERNLPRDLHREKDYREKDRDRDREDRFSRSTYKHSNSSRDNSRLRWNYENDSGPPSHRRRLDGRHNDNADMDISGDSTPTSEASYSLSGTPNTHGGGAANLNDQGGVLPPGAILQCAIGNALPRLASHPNPIAAAAVAALHYNTSAGVVSGGGGGGGGGGGPVSGATMLPTTGLASVPPTIGGGTSMSSIANSNSSSLRNSVVGHIGSTSSTTVPTLGNQEHHLNSNAPGPPNKLLVGGKEASSLLMRQQLHHALTGLDVGLHMLASGGAGGGPGASVVGTAGGGGAGGVGGGSCSAGAGGAATESVNHTYNSVNSVSATSLRDNPVNSPLYMQHAHHSLSPSLNYTKSPIPTIVGHTNNVNATSIASCSGLTNASYTCNPAAFGLKTVDGGGAGGVPGVVAVAGAVVTSGGIGGVGVGGAAVPNATSTIPGLGTVSGISVITSMGSNSLCSSAAGASLLPGSGDGPPTPTQELDLSGSALEQQQAAAAAAAVAAAAAAVAQVTQQAQQQQRKLDGASATLSTLQSCVASSVQAANLRGPEISPKLAKYFRADLITHVTNWQAEVLERQAQKCCEDIHMFGDLTCTRICAELKCARSLVRSTEINATLQEQKIMYLRQQIRRIEESKTQNAFMSDDT